MWRYRNAAHYLAGILTVGASLAHPILSIVCFLAFLSYEVDEDYHISDEAFHDILEYDIGLFVAVTALIIWRLLA